MYVAAGKNDASRDRSDFASAGRRAFFFFLFFFFYNGQVISAKRILIRNIISLNLDCEARRFTSCSTFRSDSLTAGRHVNSTMVSEQIFSAAISSDKIDCAALWSLTLNRLYLLYAEPLFNILIKPPIILFDRRGCYV